MALKYLDVTLKAALITNLGYIWVFDLQRSVGGCKGWVCGGGGRGCGGGVGGSVAGCACLATLYPM